MIWKFSAASVAAIPDLYRRYGYGLLGEALPSVLNETEFLDTPLRQWVALPILVGVGYGLGLRGIGARFRVVSPAPCSG